MQSNGDKLGEVATEASEFIDEKNYGEDSSQDRSGIESVQARLPGPDVPAESAGANGQSVPVEESSYRETPQPSEPIFGAVQRHFYGGDESE